MKTIIETPQEIKIIQQFCHLVNNVPVLVTWFRLGSEKFKAQKEVFLLDYEIQLIRQQGFLQLNHEIQNFR